MVLATALAARLHSVSPFPLVSSRHITVLSTRAKCPPPCLHSCSSSISSPLSLDDPFTSPWSLSLLLRPIIFSSTSQLAPNGRLLDHLRNQSLCQHARSLLAFTHSPVDVQFPLRHDRILSLTRNPFSKDISNPSVGRTVQSGLEILGRACPPLNNPISRSSSLSLFLNQLAGPTVTRRVLSESDFFVGYFRRSNQKTHHLQIYQSGLFMT